jgi:hypothetical protein
MSTTLESLEQQNLLEARAQAARIVEFARKDASFRQRVAEDPQGALRAFGLSERAISEIICPEPVALECTFGTCYISICPDTCVYTWGGGPGVPGI